MAGLDLAAGVFTVEDNAAGVTASPPCVLSGGEAKCPPAGADTPLVVRAGDRNDLVTEGLGLVIFGPLLGSPGQPAIVLNLGPGNDGGFGGLGGERIVGAEGSDTLIGFDGGDILLGGAGNDILDDFPGSRQPTNTGRDHYFAGSGADRIRARDFTRDLRIDCGPGTDSLQRDRFDPRRRYP